MTLLGEGAKEIIIGANKIGLFSEGCGFIDFYNTRHFFTGVLVLTRLGNWSIFAVLFIYLLWSGFILNLNMLGLCLYVPVPNSDAIEFEYYESNGLPSELKSLFKLSVFLPSQECSIYRKWRKVRLALYSFTYVFNLTFPELHVY